MYLGKMVEYASTEKLYTKPMHPYTEALLSAVPVADPDVTIERLPLSGEIPNPASPPSGCFFHPRCRYCTERCGKETPKLEEVFPGHFVSCLRAHELNLQGISYAKK